MAMPEKLLVKCGLEWLKDRMTREEAIRYGEQHVPSGFKVVVTQSDPVFRGGMWFRIDFEPE